MHNEHLNAMCPTSCTVVDVIGENHDTVTLVIDASAAPQLLTGQPGQFNMLYCFGKGEVAISISAIDAEKKYLFHTIRALGAVTHGLCALKKNQHLGIRGPFGRGWPLEKTANKQLYLIAGGLGLAPLRPVIHAAMARRIKYEKLVLIYGARSPEDQLFKQELQHWQQDKALAFYASVDTADRHWPGHIGVVTPLIEQLKINPTTALALLCGPPAMMSFCVTALQNSEISPKRMFLSLERNMKCGIGLCGHCQYGADFICKNGPVFDYASVADRERIREL